MQAFVLDPVAQTHRFRVRQERRSHLERMIGEHGLEMKSVTDRSGSPQTLVCTKDRRGYQRRCAEYQKDIAALAVLADLDGADTSKPSDVLGRIEAAQRRSEKWSRRQAWPVGTRQTPRRPLSHPLRPNP